MTRITLFFTKDRNVNILLFLCSFLLFFLFLENAFLHANAVLAANNPDAIKNYFTFIWHTVVDDGMLEYSGSNYPYGEQIIYTDCQPLFSCLLRLLPFTHAWLVGILHLLILFSYIITPCIYYKIFRRFRVNSAVAFFSSLAIVILSPQLMRINGHFGLCYACFIPLLLLQLVDYSQRPARRRILILMAYNTLVFFIHPYFGLGLCLMSILYMLIYHLLEKGDWRTMLTSLTATGLLPVFMFKAFMFLTDHHEGRSEFVYGADVYLSNTACVFVSHFGGPFEHMMKQVIKVGNREWEGLAYIGFFMNILMVAVAALSVIYFRRYKFNRIVLALLIGSVGLLLFSFGLPVLIAKSLNVESEFLNQFRAAGRYAWFFYYILPVFLIVSLDKFFKELYSRQLLRWMIPLSLLFLVLNLIEGKAYFKKTFPDSFTARNIFRADLLDASEKALVDKVKELKCAAILPIPFHHLGSEVLERNAPETCYLSMLLAYQCRVPIIGAHLSRTSVPEARRQLDLLNQFADHDSILSALKGRPIAVIQPVSTKLPDENALLKRATLKLQAGDYKLYTMSAKDFDFDPATLNTAGFVQLPATRDRVDTLGITYIRTERREPFLPASQKEYRHVFFIKKGQYAPGNYLLSFQYHFKKPDFKYFASNFLISENNGKDLPVNTLTAVRRGHLYDSMIVFEKDLHITNGADYDLILMGGPGESYRISDFLLRPDTVNVIIKQGPGGKKELINGHPYSLH